MSCADALDEANKEIESLRTQLAECQKERDAAKNCGQKVDDQLVAAQAEIARLKGLINEH